MTDWQLAILIVACFTCVAFGAWPWLALRKRRIAGKSPQPPRHVAELVATPDATLSDGFGGPTLNYDGAIASVAGDQEEYRRDRDAAEIMLKRQARLKRWEWVPWSYVRRMTIRYLREKLTYAQVIADRERVRADFYRRHVINGTKPTVNAADDADDAVNEPIDAGNR